MRKGKNKKINGISFTQEQMDLIEKIDGAIQWDDGSDMLKFTKEFNEKWPNQEEKIHIYISYIVKKDNLKYRKQNGKINK